jgi:hypothetical protein
MRTTRAYIAGLGTTGSLVAAAACVFLVASAVIAFNGWPGGRFADRIGNIFVNDQPPVAWDQPGTLAVAAGAGAAAGAVAATPAGPTFGAPGVVLAGNGTAVLRGGSVSGPGGAIVSTLPAGAASNGGGGDGSGSPLIDTGPVRNQVASTVQQAGGGVSQTVRDTTRTVGNALGGPAGNAVTQTGNTVGSTVDHVTQTAGGLLKP